MAYYIYPKGTTGEQLAWMMEYVDGVKVSFVDDGDEKLSFETQRNKIGVDDVVYVALSKLSPNYEENLKNIVAKLERHRINYSLDIVLEYVNKSIDKLKKECQSEGISKIVCLVMAGFARNKHYGKLGKELAQRLKFSSRGGDFICLC